MGTDKKQVDGCDLTLFELPPPLIPEPKVKRPEYAIWTENKARLVERYLHYFVFITKHGTYIDGFAGPQKRGEPDMWAAKLVLESEPKWLRNFYLFDKDNKQVEWLNTLKSLYPDRNINIYGGDFNVLLPSLLDSGSMKQTDATFCLLDQRTFECHWSTLRSLAQYKKSGYKIELFYFLPSFWLNRALAAQKNTEVLERWWGRADNWDNLRKMGSHEFLEAFVDRFKKELGYWSVKPWPIYQREEALNIMYYMIHATDHPVAPSLMSRAYKKAVLRTESVEQLALDFEVPSPQP